MADKPKITAYVDTKGNLRCAACQAKSDAAVDFSVYSDNSAFHDDRCDTCCVSLNPAAKPQPIWITRRDLYNRMVSAQNTCWAYDKPQEFDNALAFIDTEAALIRHVEYAEGKAAQAVALKVVA